MSCERLRALLPWFDGRKEDMASVLEMAVQFLQLAGTLVPGWEQQAVSHPVTAGSALWGGAMGISLLPVPLYSLEAPTTGQPGFPVSPPRTPSSAVSSRHSSICLSHLLWEPWG